MYVCGSNALAAHSITTHTHNRKHAATCTQLQAHNLVLSGSQSFLPPSTAVVVLLFIIVKDALSVV